jgi:hypothetical protein
MTNSDKATVVLLAAAVGMALYRFYNMTENERENFYNDIKDRVQLLLKDTDQTVDTVKQYFGQIDSKEAWADKLLLFKGLLTRLFGTGEKALAY